jgi:hypothetical protein
MRSRLALAALALSLGLGACDRDAPSGPNSVGDQAAPPTASAPGAPTAPKAGKQPLIFRDGLPQGPFISTTTGIAYTVAAVQITKFSYVNGQLLVDGGLYDASGALISAFQGAPATLTSSGAPTQPTCQILNLDIGAIHLDLLGLVIDLAPIHLDITAQSGPGNLLGNLLCALVNLLNPGNPLQTAITQLLNQINALLAALLAGL